ncbi:MAG: AAA family ATPase [Planctomycetota bacterium]|nr:AAA family ATPase [Planctomycetota bacterium]
MELLPDARLTEVLAGLNPWWTTGSLPQSARFTQARSIDGFLHESERPVLVTGPRRAGKTSTLLRLVDHHLRSGRSPNQVVYLNFDHPLLRLEPLGPLVDRVLKQIDSSKRPLLLLDGLQAVADWPERFVEVVKTRPHPRIVGTASVRPDSEDNAYESATLWPLRFREFCALRGLPELETPPLDLVDPQAPQEDPAEDYLFDRVLDPMLADYLVRGGFPEAALEHDLRSAQTFVRDAVVSRAVYQDLPSVVGVWKLADLERVLIAALSQGGEPLVMESFSDALELDRATVARYLEHLGRAFLLTPLKNYAAATDRSRARLHPTDPSLSNALLERGATVLARPRERRALIVSAVVSHVAEAVRERGFDVAYFREGEVACDVVVVTPEGAIPILVVDRDEVTEEEEATVERLIKRLKVRHVFVLSRARPRRRAPLSFFESAIHLPASYFLYALRA